MTEDELRRGLLAILFQPDRDARYLASGTWRWPTIQAARDAYGSDSPRLRWRPSPADVTLGEALEPKLCGLAIANGRGAVKAMFAWAAGVPTWRLAQERRLTARGMRYSLRRWMRSLGVAWDEAPAPEHGTHTAPAKGTSTENVTPLRTYAGGRYVRNGRHLPAAD
jgi:hypothetical protein